MRGSQQAGKTGGLPHRDHLGPRSVKIQVTTDRATGIEFLFPQLGACQVNKVHAFAHHQQVLLRVGFAAQRMQLVGNVLGGAKINLAFHSQQFELRAFRQA